MRKTRTIEEVRAKDRERQAKWREKNRVLSRERVAYVYGKSKMPQLVEERMKPATREAYRVPEGPERINRVITNPPAAKKIDEERLYEEDPEDCRTPAEKAQAEAYAKRGGALRFAHGAGGAPEVDKPLSEAEQKAADDLARLQAKRKAHGVPVTLEGV
jgi:hypothetical protein